MMALYPIYEYPINHISKCICHFLATHLLDEDNNINLDVHLNLTILDLWSLNIIIPDLHLNLGMPEMISVLFWVMECSFSSLPMSLELKLWLAAEMVPEIDFVFIFCICETEFCSPLKFHDLHSCLPLAHFTFVHLPSTPLFTPIIIKDIKWIEIVLLTVYASLWGEDGKIRFHMGNYFAEDISAFHTNTFRSNFALVFVPQTSYSRLLNQVTDMMESIGCTNTKKINHFHTESESVTFDTQWSVLLRDYQKHISDICYHCYEAWHQEEGDSDLEYVYLEGSDNSDSIAWLFLIYKFALWTHVQLYLQCLFSHQGWSLTELKAMCVSGWSCPLILTTFAVDWTNIKWDGKLLLKDIIMVVLCYKAHHSHFGSFTWTCSLSTITYYGELSLMSPIILLWATSTLSNSLGSYYSIDHHWVLEH